MKQIAFLGLTATLVCACDATRSVDLNPPDVTVFAVTPTTGVVRVDLGTLGGPSSYAADVNGDATVVGWSQTASGVAHAFRWTALHGMGDLGTLPGDVWSRAIRITSDGRILGVSGARGTDHGTPVVWNSEDPPSITTLPILLLEHAAFGEPTDFNDEGEVVGWDVFVAQHAWVWSESEGKYDITANVPGDGYEGVASGINRSGLVVGTNNSRTACTGPPRRPASCWRAFLWSRPAGYRELGIPGDDPNTTVMGAGVNDAGTVVGSVAIPTVGLQPYRWSERDGFTVLPTFPETRKYGYALGVNSRGTAVGASQDQQYGAIQAAAWPRAGGIVKLSPGDPYPGIAVAVNAWGAVAGWSSLDCCGGQNHATLWIPSPGPSPPRAAVAAESGPSPSPTNLGLKLSGAGVCLSDSHALVSRQALFACVVKSEGNP